MAVSASVGGYSDGFTRRKGKGRWGGSSLWMQRSGSGQPEGVEALRINGDVVWSPKKKTETMRMK